MLCPVIVWSVLMTALSALDSSDEFYTSWVDKNLANVTSHVLAKRNAKSGYTADEKKEILDEHNKARGQEGAQDMLTLVWDDALEQNAQKHADKCDFSHSSRSERSDIGGFKYVGENLFVTTGTPSPKQVVSDWYNEKQYYTFDTMACADGQACGHYTQVVWAKTSALGCGVKFCVGIAHVPPEIKEGYIVNCQYGPGGNMVNVKPYIKAPPGSSSAVLRAELIFVSLTLSVVYFCF